MGIFTKKKAAVTGGRIAVFGVNKMYVGRFKDYAILLFNIFITGCERFGIRVTNDDE